MAFVISRLFVSTKEMKAAKAVRDAAEEAEKKGKGKKAQRDGPGDVHNG